MLRRARAHDGWRRSLASLSVAVAVWAAGGAAIGAESSAPTKSAEAPRPSRLTVSVDASACSIVLVDEVLYLAKIELHNQLVDSPAADCRVTITCAGTRVAVVARTSDGKGRVHETDMSEVSDGLRPRVVALAVAELVHEIELAEVEPL